MKQIANQDRPNSYSYQFLNELQKLFNENLRCNKEDLSSIEKCFKQYINNDEQVAAIIKYITEQKHLDKIQNTMSKIDEQANILRGLIFSGPTNKPRLYDPKFIIPMHEKHAKRKEFEKILQELKLNFQIKIHEPYANDKFYRMKELLYIWFCSEPKKLLLAIKEVQSKAAQQGSASFKALNITLTN